MSYCSNIVTPVRFAKHRHFQVDTFRIELRSQLRSSGFDLLNPVADVVCNGKKPPRMTPGVALDCGVSVWFHIYHQSAHLFYVYGVLGLPVDATSVSHHKGTEATADFMTKPLVTGKHTVALCSIRSERLNDLGKK